MEAQLAAVAQERADRSVTGAHRFSIADKEASGRFA
jgi:hypothetical protein